jgi:hypothetical protein
MAREGSRLPRRAPELLSRIARKGCGKDAARRQRGRSPFCRPSTKARSAGSKRQPGRLFFGYFLLAEQKKVTRLRVREPDTNNRRASDSLTNEEML